MHYPSYKEVEVKREELITISTSHWLHHDLYSWQWWFLLISSILPWMIWVKLVSKTRRLEIFSYAILFALIATFLDVVGANNLLWGYPTKLLPTVPPLIPADLTFYPVVFSLLYQVSSSWKSYLLAITVMAAFVAFVIEPFFIMNDMYITYHFPHWATFIGIILVAIFTKWMIEKMKAV